MIELRINSEPCSFPAGTTLQTALEQEGIADRSGIAVALDGSVVPRPSWNDTQLNSNQEIIVITATQGG